MATDTPQIRDGSNVVAGADLSTKQFYAVKLSAANTVILAGAGDLIYGILQNKPTSGQAADVSIFGVTKAILGGTVTGGNKLKVDSAGKLVANSTGDTTVAMAIIDGVSGDIATVKVLPTAG